MAKINAVKTTYDGYEFDSLTECEFYKHLKNLEDVQFLKVHPHYKLIDEFEIKCGRCYYGQVKSPKTGRKIKCKRCGGEGFIKRQPWTYTPDFEVHWKDGSRSYYDVKGGFKNERFNLVKKMFEKTFSTELLVVKQVKGQWKYM